MSSPEERMKHSRRIKAKLKERQRSKLAKELITSGKSSLLGERSGFKQRVIMDKRGKAHDLDTLDHAKLVKLINELDGDN